MNGTILANRSAQDRNKTDFYPTPPDVTVALLEFLEKQGHIDTAAAIWEPACGTGAMAEVMKWRGYDVFCTDLHPNGYGHPIPVDFLGDAHYDHWNEWIITNPPFSLAEKFIRRALELDKPFAFLLKSQFWHAKSRLTLFRDHPPAYVLPLTWRPDFLQGAKGGSPTMECLWTVWLGNDCITEYHPLPRPAGDCTPPHNPFEEAGA